MEWVDRFVDLAAESSVQAAITKIGEALSGIGANGTKIDGAVSKIDANGTELMRIKESLEAIKAALNVFPAPVYGFIDHMGVTNPAQKIEYIGKNKDYTPLTIDCAGHTTNYGSWADFYILKNNRPAMVSYDGTVDYYLNPDDYTKKEDGTESDITSMDYAGNAFSWIEKIYKWEYIIGNDRYVWFSQAKLNDNFIPAGFVDPDNKVLDGVWIPMFYGTLDSESRLRSIGTGSPIINGSTDNQKTWIDKNGSRYVFFGGSVMCTIIDLLTMFVKTTNLQEAYGYGNRSGYVGDASAGAGYGTIANGVVDGGQFYGSRDGKSLNKILHSIVLGTQNVWMRDPYTLCVNGTYKVSPNYKYDVTGAAYVDIGRRAPATGWQKKLLAVPGFGALPAETGASDSTGYCDHIWVNPGIVAVALRLASCDNGSSGGLYALNCLDAASVVFWCLGAALLLLQKPSGSEAA